VRLFIDAYQNNLAKGVISDFYDSFLEKKQHDSKYIKEKWEAEGNISISNEVWSEICQFQWKCSNSHVWREFGWKCLVRFFVTPKQKAHFSNGEATCWRQCGSQEANHWHIFWECPVIKNFWIEFHRTINTIFGANLPLEFTTLFLGHANFQTIRSEEYLFGILISACRKVFTRHWLLPEAPTIKEWIDIVNDIYNMEHITFALRLQKEIFIKYCLIG